jgi:hypothetical protein
MRLAALVALLAVAGMQASDPVKPKVPRGSMAPLESSFDVRITRPGQEDPFDLLGNTRGVYLDGYGVVFTSELNLIVTPGMSPFRPQITKEEIERTHQRKVAKLQVLKKAMREMMVSSAAAIDRLPPNEQVVVAVTLFYYSWEDRTGLPSQILMQAPKSALVGGPGQSPDAALQVKEF